MKKQILFLASISAVIIYSCKPSTVVTTTHHDAPKLALLSGHDYESTKMPNGSDINSFIFNKNMNQIDFNFPTLGNNNGTIKMITNAGVTLGRVLFYDKLMSLNNSVSCGSCHHQDKAFTDGQALSKGFEGRLTTRSSMCITNTAMQNNLFWDSRSKTLQDLALQPVANHIEMGMEDMNKLVVKLSKADYYKNLFKNAYGNEEITQAKISNALSQFVSAVVSNATKFDLVETGKQQSTTPVDKFSALEEAGHSLFQDKCGSCHVGLSFSADDGPNGSYGGSTNSSSDLKGAANIGLDLVYKDNGLGQGKFKIPTLRNIELTAPYMHDGRFNTLEEVMDHYAKGIKPHPALDSKFRNANSSVKFIEMNDAEKHAIIAFLKTLTDRKMTTDPKYSDPFTY
jgi:cytochrome c peroxidase